MRRILIDSDVILDLFVALEPHHTVALHFFSRMELERGAIVATTSPVALANVAYVMAKLKDFLTVAMTHHEGSKRQAHSDEHKPILVI